MPKDPMMPLGNVLFSPESRKLQRKALNVTELIFLFLLIKNYNLKTEVTEVTGWLSQRSR